MGAKTVKTPLRGIVTIRTPSRGTPIRGTPSGRSDGVPDSSVSPFDAKTTRMASEVSMVFELASRDSIDPVQAAAICNANLAKELNRAKDMAEQLQSMHAETFQRMDKAQTSLQQLSMEFMLYRADSEAALQRITGVASDYRHHFEELLEMTVFSPENVPIIFQRFPWLELKRTKQIVCGVLTLLVLLTAVWHWWMPAIVAACLCLGALLHYYLTHRALPNTP